MKKAFIFIMIAAALGMTACDNTTKTKTEPETKQASLKGSDMAVFDGGKLSFYNSTTNVFTPFTAEKDYVVTGVFAYDEEFYYTVSVDDELYLKKIDLLAEAPVPVQLADWELKLSDCYDESCEKCASMDYIIDVQFVGIEYNMGEMCKGFQDEKYYLIDEKTVSDGWPEDVDDSFMALQAFIDQEHFISLPKEEGSDEKYFFHLPESKGLYGSEEEIMKDAVCISDQINFYEGKYEGWEGKPDFMSLGLSPDGDCVVYAAIMEWGRGGRGPLCFATLDGKVQKLLEYDASYGWLDDGRLIFNSPEGIKAVSADGTINLISPAKTFVTKN